MSQDFLPKLKGYLISCLKATLVQESAFVDSRSDSLHSEASATCNTNQSDCDLVYLKSNWIYLHKLVHIQYTTYDVRREQDIVNPSTPHRDIMLLATTTDNDVDHLFLYAHVLGIYHTNITYAGDDIQNYQARQFKFLWVCWYRYQSQNVWWRDLKLDVLSFPLVTSNGTFGFVDPGNVLCTCHIIPAFSSGKKYPNEVSLSHSTNDSQDWSRYYVSWYVQVSTALAPHLSYLTQLCWLRHDDEVLLGFCHWSYICSQSTIGHFGLARPNWRGWQQSTTWSKSSWTWDKHRRWARVLPWKSWGWHSCWRQWFHCRRQSCR